MNFPSFEKLIVSGGDSRLDLLENGLNKYNVDPCDFRSTFSRASCTCSPFSPDGYEAAYSLYNKLSELDFDEVRNQQTAKIKSLLNYEQKDRFHVFYAPSGSDLCYYSLLFSKLISPDRDIFNVITCPEELGSGSLNAHAGRYFDTRNQFGETIASGSKLSDELIVDSAEFSARDADGEIVNHSQAILDEIHNRYHSHSVTANLVIGSKSGIENNTTIVSRAPEDVLWTIDLCQFRASRVLINGLLGMNCCVMLTGSKFYQSPPFCAVVLVPKTITEKFREDALANAHMFRNIFASHDIPAEFPSIREHLRDFRNYGLLLRWQAALAEMSALAELDSFRINQAVGKWNEFAVNKLNSESIFEIMPGQKITNKTIISFRVKKGANDYFSHSELRNLYNRICQKRFDNMQPFEKLLIGQPVKYRDKSFIRLALGSSDLRKFASDETDFSLDSIAIENIKSVVNEIIQISV